MDIRRTERPASYTLLMLTDLCMPSVVAQRWPEAPNFAPSVVRRHVKYSSRTFIDAKLGTGPTYAVCEKYMDRGARSSYAGHAGTPGPLGSPFFAKFVQ